MKALINFIGWNPQKFSMANLPLFTVCYVTLHTMANGCYVLQVEKLFPPNLHDISLVLPNHLVLDWLILRNLYSYNCSYLIGWFEYTDLLYQKTGAVSTDKVLYSLHPYSSVSQYISCVPVDKQCNYCTLFSRLLSKVYMSYLFNHWSVYFWTTAYCKSFKVEKLHGFCGSIDNRETFPVK